MGKICTSRINAIKTTRSSEKGHVHSFEKTRNRWRKDEIYNLKCVFFPMGKIMKIL